MGGKPQCDYNPKRYAGALEFIYVPELPITVAGVMLATLGLRRKACYVPARVIRPRL